MRWKSVNNVSKTRLDESRVSATSSRLLQGDLEERGSLDCYFCTGYRYSTAVWRADDVNSRDILFNFSSTSVTVAQVVKSNNNGMATGSRFSRDYPKWRTFDVKSSTRTSYVYSRADWMRQQEENNKLLFDQEEDEWLDDCLVMSHASTYQPTKFHLSLTFRAKNNNNETKVQ